MFTYLLLFTTKCTSLTMIVTTATCCRKMYNNNNNNNNNLFNLSSFTLSEANYRLTTWLSR